MSVPPVSEKTAPFRGAGETGNGMRATIRQARPDDASALLALKRALDRETSFMLLEPGERTTGEAEERSRLEAICRQSNAVALVAEGDGKLVGYVEAVGGKVRRNRGTAHVVIGVLASHAGQGIGTGLLAELERSAMALGIHRLELTVIAHNKSAIALYRKMGYETEGTRRAALLVADEVIDEFWMAKLLQTVEPAQNAPTEAR